MKLSILICSLTERSESIKRLLDTLNCQATKDVEILLNIDNRQRTIGEKRQSLLDSAIGEYIVFIDDDDAVPEYYVEEILKAIESKPDCVGFWGEIESSVNNVKRRVHYSRENIQWSLKDDVYLRNIQHVTPVRREILSTFEFPHVTVNEDNYMAGWLMVDNKIKTQVFIDKVMYFYRANYTI